MEVSPPPKGLQYMNTVRLPLTMKYTNVDDGIGEWISVQEIEVCSKCASDLGPVVRKWLSEGQQQQKEPLRKI